MSLETLYLISQIVGVVVIVATLGAIFWQGWQTNKIARAELTLNWWMAAGAMNQSVIDSEDKAAFMTRIFDPSAKLSAPDMTRIAFQMHTHVGVFQAAHALRGRRLVEEAPYSLAKSGMTAFMASAVARGWWRAHRAGGYAPEFREIMDAIVAEAEAAPNERSVGVKSTA